MLNFDIKNKKLGESLVAVQLKLTALFSLNYLNK